MPTLRELGARLLRVVILTTDERDADGKWVWRGEDGEPCFWSSGDNRRTVFEPVETVAEANGVRFLCPKSFAGRGEGAHSVYVFFQGSPYAGHNKAGQEVRWQVVGGSTVDDLSRSPSILEQDDGLAPEHRCGWHGWVGSSGVPPGSAA